MPFSSARCCRLSEPPALLSGELPLEASRHAQDAEAVLTEAERALFAAKSVPKRRAEWLFGRLVAKHALRRASAEVQAGSWTLSAIEIRALPSGQPVFAGPDARLDGWSLSLSHGHGHAVAVAAPGPVGLDWERVQAIPEGGWRFFLSEAERAAVAAAPDVPAAAVRLWALKEAAYKALGGAVATLREFELLELSDATARLAAGPHRLVARYGWAGGGCWALATPEPAGAWFDALAPDWWERDAL